MSDFLSDTAGWFKLSKSDQALVVDQDFKDTFAGRKEYINANATGRAQLKEAFKQANEEAAYNSVNNPANINADSKQVTANNSNWLSNIFTKAVDSHKEAARRVPLTSVVVGKGSYAPGLADYLSESFKQDESRIYTTAEREVADRILVHQKEWDKGGVLNRIKTVLSGLSEIPSNMEGITALAADSASSITNSALSAFGGGFVGGLAGSEIPIIGNIAGAAIGTKLAMTGAVAADSATSKFKELVRDELTKRKLVPTASNIQSILDDTEAVNGMKAKSQKYGAAMGIAETAFSSLIGKAATISEKSALSAAKTSLREADHTVIASLSNSSGKTLREATEYYINAKAQNILKAKTLKSKVLGSTGAYIAEAGSEPLTEAIATTASGDQNTFTNLTNEFLGGIGTGPISAAVDKAAFGTKIAGSQAKAFVDNIISATPESKAIAKTQKDALNTEVKLNKTQADAKYNDDVANISHTDATHADLSNPEHTSYNPIKATEILVKDESPEAYNKAVAIEQHERKILEDTKTRLKEIADLNDSVGLTPEEKAEGEGLLKRLKPQAYRVNKLNSFVDTIYNNVTAKRNKERDSIAKLDPTTATQSQIVESVSFGSSPHKNALTNDTIDELQKRTDLDDDVKTLLADQKQSNTIRKTIEEQATRPNTTGKTISDVSNDIYHGMKGSDFKGIDSYVQGITHFLNPQVNNVEKATKELNGLRKFSDVMNEKASVASAVLESMKADANYVATKAQQVVLDRHGLKIHPIKARNLVANIVQEAKALKSEVKTSESLFRVLSNKTNTSSSTTTQTTPVASNSKPTTAPAVVTIPPATKPVVSSKTTNDVTQTTGQIREHINSGKPYILGITEKPTLQRQLVNEGYVRLLDTNSSDKSKHTATFKQSAKQESAKSKTSKLANTNESFPTQADVIVDEEASFMQDAGLTPDHPAYAPILERRKREAFQLDTVTEAGIVAHFEKTFDRAWKAFKKGQQFVYGEMDMGNVGGANAKLGTSAFDIHFKAMVGIIKNELALATNNTAQLFRKGGDEFGVIAPNSTAEEINDILEIAQAKILEYANANGMSDIVNPKPDRYDGVRLVYSVRDFTGFDSVAELRSVVDREVEQRKKKSNTTAGQKDNKNGNNSKTQKTGTVSSGEQTRGTGQSPSTTRTETNSEVGGEAFGTTTTGFNPTSKLKDSSFTTGNGTVVEIRGRIINFNGLPNLPFMVYKHDGLGFTISDTGTNKRVIGYFDTQKIAIARIEQQIQEMGIDKLYAIINQERKVQGLEPLTYIKDSIKPSVNESTPADSNTAITEVLNEVAVDEPINETPQQLDDVPDNLSAVDNIGDIEIQVGVDAEGKPIMKLYSEVIADIDSQIEEANNILKCVKG